MTPVGAHDIGKRRLWKRFPVVSVLGSDCAVFSFLPGRLVRDVYQQMGEKPQNSETNSPSPLKWAKSLHTLHGV
jgi:hypothetical protein